MFIWGRAIGRVWVEEEEDEEERAWLFSTEIATDH